MYNNTMQNTRVLWSDFLKTKEVAKVKRKRIINSVYFLVLKVCSTPTWRLTRKPEWLKDFSPTANVSQVDAIDGLFAIVKPTRAIPGPTKPIDCREDSENLKGGKDTSIWSIKKSKSKKKMANSLFFKLYIILVTYNYLLALFHTWKR